MLIIFAILSLNVKTKHRRNLRMQSKITSNLIWRFLERCGAQIVTFVVSIILARILSPAEYGEIAIITIIITILNVFVDAGFANALIQKEKPDDLDYSTVFYFNIFLCIIVYLTVFILAPLVGVFYSNNHLIPLLRVLGITIIVSGIKNVQQAYVAKNFLFRRFFYSTLGGTLFSAIIGVVMAIRGFGTWALVAQHLSNLIVDTSILWITVKWRPQKIFSIYRLKELFSYGYKLLLSSLLNTVYDNFRQLIIGRHYSASDLAYYNKGKQFPSLVMTNINTSIDSVLFPAMAEKQNDYVEVQAMIKKMINVSTYILWPLLFGLCGISDSLIRIILTDKWISAVPFLRVFCFVYATYPIQTANLNALKAVGRSDSFFKLEIEQTLIGIVFLLCAMNNGPIWIARMYLFTAVISVALICYESYKVFHYSFANQLLDLFPNFAISSIMLIVVIIMEKTKIGGWFIVLEIIVGGAVYVICSCFTDNKNFKYVLEMIKRIFTKKH